MRKIRKLSNFVLLGVSILVLASCSPTTIPALSTPPDLAATAEVLRTQVANTVVAGMTATFLAIPPSETPQPTDTDTPVPDTATPTATIILPTAPPTLTPTRVYATLWPGYTSTPSDFQCTITAQSLSYGIIVKAGVDFDSRWTVKNTGTEDWGSSGLHFDYVSGTKFQQYTDSYKVSTGVATGKSVTLIADMLAPKDPGFYHAQWALIYGDTTLCYLPVDIRVQ